MDSKQTELSSVTGKKSLNNLIDGNKSEIKQEVKTEVEIEYNIDHNYDELNCLDDETETIHGDQEIRSDPEENDYGINTNSLKLETDPNNQNLINNQNFKNLENEQIAIRNMEENNLGSQIANDEASYLTFKADDSMDIIYKSRLDNKVFEAKECIRKFTERIMYQIDPLKAMLGDNEKKYGFFCPFGPPVQCPVEKSFTGRWRMKMEKLIVALNDSNTKLTPENSKVNWSIKRPGEFIKSETNEMDDIPPYIANLIKKFEDFLNTSPVIQRKASRDPGVPKKSTTEFHEIQFRSNCNCNVMVLLIGCNIKEEIKQDLLNYLNYISYPNLKSVYVRTLTNKKSYTDFLYGERQMTEYIGENIHFQITPTSNFYSNTAGVELESEIIYNMIKRFNYEAVLMVGCGLGLICLLLSEDIEDVHGIDENSVLRDAEKIRVDNKNLKVRYKSSDKVDSILKQFKLESKKFCVIINNNSNVGRSPSMIDKLHNILDLKHIIVMSTFQMTHAKVLDKLFEPLAVPYGYPFLPKEGCIVDPTPSSKHYQVVVLLERQAIVKRHIENRVKDSNRHVLNEGLKSIKTSHDNRSKEHETEKSIVNTSEQIYKKNENGNTKDIYYSLRRNIINQEDILVSLKHVINPILNKLDLAVGKTIKEYLELLYDENVALKKKVSSILNTPTEAALATCELNQKRAVSPTLPTNSSNKRVKYGYETNEECEGSYESSANFNTYADTRYRPSTSRASNNYYHRSEYYDEDNYRGNKEYSYSHPKNYDSRYK